MAENKTDEMIKGEFYHELKINREECEKVVVALQYLTQPLELGKAAQVLIDYDPNRPMVSFKYFHPNQESSEEESRLK